MKLRFPGYYCIDTCALIDLKDDYPADIFPSLWRNLQRLVSDGRLTAPREVLKELEAYEDKDDPLLKWAKKNRHMFTELTPEQVQTVKEIEREFRKLADPDKTPADADPFIIALATYESCSVVTSEQPGSPNKPHIPDVCTYYEIEYLSLVEFFREEKWEY